MTVDVKTFGCRLNHCESDQLKQQLEAKNINDVFIVNTCAVTKEAERQARQAVRKIRREHPNRKILVTGCAATLNPKQFTRISNVEIIEKNFQVESRHTPEMKDRTKAFLEIQNGCNHNCSFCTITIARGKNRSVPHEYIIHDINHLVEQGFYEIALTGVNIIDYGTDLYGQRSLGSLVLRILQETDLQRLRLSSLDPDMQDEKLLDLFNTEPRLMPYMHLSVQSGNNRILKLMKRRHTREDIIHIINRFKRYITLSADIIVGFPDEQIEEFNDTYDLIKKYFTMVHVFPYSSRPMTLASYMEDNVSPQEKKRRLQILRATALENKINMFKSFVGCNMKVLLEDNCMGYSPEYFLVKTNNGIKGHIYDIMITGYTQNYLIGNVI